MKRGFGRILLVGLIGSLIFAACTSQFSESNERTMPRISGDPNLGQHAIVAYGCGACHTIPGVPAANAYVGPPLNHWARRTYIAGNMTNSTENLIFWLQFPQQVEPGTAMPNLNVTRQDAENIAAYLFSLD